EPRLVGQVQFTEWTTDGKLRHPSFQGLREDKSPMEATLESAAPPPKRAAGKKKSDDDAPTVKLTNPDKVLYPKDGYTKHEQPDWVIFDLDPAEGRGVDQATPVALALHRLFAELSMPSVVKTTGKRGLHVMVPLLPGHTHDDAVEFALKIGGAVTSVVKEAT